MNKAIIGTVGEYEGTKKYNRNLGIIDLGSIDGDTGLLGRMHKGKE